jgi:hypothetical protein
VEVRSHRLDRECGAMPPSWPSPTPSRDGYELVSRAAAASIAAPPDFPSARIDRALFR